MDKEIKKGVLKRATADCKETTEGPVVSLTVFIDAVFSAQENEDYGKSVANNKKNS